MGHDCRRRSWACRIFLPCLLASAAFAAPESDIAPGARGAFTVAGHRGACELYVPRDWEAGARMPLILFMHGAGGKPTTFPWEFAADKGWLVLGLAYAAQEDLAAGGIRSDPATASATLEYIKEAIDQVDAAYGVDRRTVVLTGLSMGGWGVSSYGLRTEARGLFAAFAILAAGPRAPADFSVAEGLPFLVLNGEQDPNLAAADEGTPLIEEAGAIVTKVVIPGEGHVPSIDSMRKPLREWLDTVRSLRRGADRLAAVRWIDVRPTGEQVRGKAGKDEDLAAWVAAESRVREAAADQPVLVFLVSRLTGKDGRDTSQAAQSRKVEEEVFSFPNANALALAARHCTCLRLDMSQADPKANPLASSRDVPLVVILKPDRSLAAVLRGASLGREKPILDVLLDLLDPELGIPEAAAARRGGLAELEKAVGQVRKQEAVVAKLASARATNDRARETKKRRLSEERAQLAELEAKVQELVDAMLAP